MSVLNIIADSGGRLLAGIAGSNPAGRMDVCPLCVLSGWDLCDGLIARPEEYYRMWCVWVWSWSLDNEETLAHWGAVEQRKNYNYC
jgi:hypothetical protein